MVTFVQVPDSSIMADVSAAIEQDQDAMDPEDLEKMLKTEASSSPAPAARSPTMPCELALLD